VKSRLTLVGLDIEGEWNVPLLANAAEMSGASLLFARSTIAKSEMTGNANSSAHIDILLSQFDHVLACEATKQSRSVYDFPAPRGHLGVIVGNEKQGIPGKVLKKVDRVVSIPMSGRGMSSVNVAVAGAIVLYTLERDLGRRRIRTSPLLHKEVDVLLLGPSDPSELGSLLRSAWAFGWQQVFLVDPNSVWFTKDRPTVLASRAAARGEVNHLAVRPHEQLMLEDYDQIVICGSARTGKPLSRYSLPDRGRVLLVFGEGDLPFAESESVEHIHVDHAALEAMPCYRHAGSILLSVISQQLKRGRRG
jgi:tRNA G18 (ribose-2'-O)-methylase SpoU